MASGAFNKKLKQRFFAFSNFKHFNPYTTIAIETQKCHINTTLLFTCTYWRRKVNGENRKYLWSW